MSLIKKSVCELLKGSGSGIDMKIGRFYIPIHDTYLFEFVSLPVKPLSLTVTFCGIFRRRCQPNGIN